MNRVFATGRDKLDTWLFRTWLMPAGHAFACRTLVAGYLLFEGVTLGRAFEGLPCEAMVSLPGPFMFLDCYPPSWFVHGLSAVTLFATALVLLGIFPVWSGVAACLSRVVLDGAHYSLGGKIDHVLPVLVALPLLAVATRRNSRKEDSAWPFAYLALCIGFVMFTAGVFKLRGGWLSLDDSAVYGHIVKNNLWLGRDQLLSNWASQLRAPWFWELQDYLTVVIELLFLPAVFLRRRFVEAVFIMTVLHVGIAVTMNICFTENLIVYCVLLPWPMGAYALAARLEAVFNAMTNLVKVGLSVVIVACMFAFGPPAHLFERLFGALTWHAIELLVLAVAVFAFIVRSYTGPNPAPSAGS